MKNQTWIFLTCTALIVAAPTARAADIAPIEIQRTVDAPIEDVWASWASSDGAESFFAPKAVVKPQIDGEYSMLFFPDNAAGSRGAEGMRILAIEPPKRLVVSWNSPKFFGPVREQRAVLEIRLDALSPDQTSLTLRHFGWGTGPEWAAIRHYFNQAWPLVLDRLDYRFAVGPVDWANLPDELLYRAGD